MGRGARHERLDRAIDEVARGGLRLEEIADGEIRERVRIALRLNRDLFDDVDPARRERIRRTIGRHLPERRRGPSLLARAHAERIVSIASRQAALVSLEAEEGRIGALARPAADDVVAAVKRLAERAQEAVERARKAKDAGSRGTLAAGGVGRP